jgi:Mg-chelatase subunit ChlD
LNLDKAKENETKKKDLSKDRAGVDLICVIDKSGSMSGYKIELVKKTLI